MVFFRVSLTAALLSRLVTSLGLQGHFVGWFAVVAKTGLYVAFVELVLDLTWVMVTRFDPRGVAPPRILKDLALVTASVAIVAAELNSQGLLSTVGSAAVLGGLAFLVGPGSGIKSVTSQRPWQFRLSVSLRLATGWRLPVSWAVWTTFPGTAPISMTIGMTATSLFQTR